LTVVAVCASILAAAPQLSALQTSSEVSEESPAPPAAGPLRLRLGERRLLAAVNRYRARFHLPPLKADPILMRVARQRAPFVTSSRAAGEHGYNHHAGGRWSRQHAREEGFPGPATDNLAMGYETPEDAVEGWAIEDQDADPAGHNYQMRGKAKVNGRWVDEEYNRIGIGIVGRNYIAIFGRQPTVRK
jgi:uncharacterized protein YkwD